MDRAGADLGSPSIKVRPNGIPKTVPEEKTLEQIGKSLAECGAFARDHGIVVQLEVHGEESQRVPRIRKMFDYGGNHPSVRACWNSNQEDLLDGGFDANSACCAIRSARFTCATVRGGVSLEASDHVARRR